MIRARIPGNLPKTGNLRVMEHIGTLGYVHSTVLESGNWRPGGIIYLHPDIVSVEWEIVGRTNSRFSTKLASILAPLENFGKISRKSRKNAPK
jgi:hypothetical protein